MPNCPTLLISFIHPDSSFYVHRLVEAIWATNFCKGSSLSRPLTSPLLVQWSRLFILPYLSSVGETRECAKWRDGLWRPPSGCRLLIHCAFHCRRELNHLALFRPEMSPLWLYPFLWCILVRSSRFFPQPFITGFRTVKIEEVSPLGKHRDRSARAKSVTFQCAMIIPSGTHCQCHPDPQH